MARTRSHGDFDITARSGEVFNIKARLRGLNITLRSQLYFNIKVMSQGYFNINVTGAFYYQVKVWQCYRGALTSM